MNKIFHIKMTEKGKEYSTYDTYSDFVIIAKNEKRARSLCHCADECRDWLWDNKIPTRHEYVEGKGYNKSKGCFWSDPRTSEVIILGETELKEQVVCDSFHSG